MLLKSIDTPRGVIINVSEYEAKAIFGASDDAIQAARTQSLMEELRLRRDKLLLDSDWTQMPDVALSDIQKTVWRKYRTDLRNLPESLLNTHKIEWPIAPEL
ncbi:MAG: phage tail assembly chaperone [Proteobacteria bacterium]|nr:phage tail assembly chaperone [Pseudomonadota bacterium]